MEFENDKFIYFTWDWKTCSHDERITLKSVEICVKAQLRWRTTLEQSDEQVFYSANCAACGRG